MKLRCILLFLTLFSCLTALVGVFFFYQQSVNSNIAREEQSAETTARLIAVKLDTAIESFIKASRTLSSLPDIVGTMSEYDEQGYIKSKFLLYQFCDKGQASLCYLLKPDGLTVVDNRGPDQNSLEGNNYTFRPYFSEALKQGGYVYAALGTVTKKRGLYFSRRIENEDAATLGVAVIKVSMEYLESEINNFEGTAVLINPDGIIFSSSDKNWEMSSLWPISKARMSEIIASNQFGTNPIPSLGFLKEIKQQRLYSNNHSDVFIVGQSDLKTIPGWQLLYLDRSPKFFWLDDMVVPLVSLMFFLASAASLMLYRVGTRDLKSLRETEQELQSSEQRLRQLAELTNEGVLIHKDGIILDTNNAAAEIFDYPEVDLIGKDIWSLMAVECVSTAHHNMTTGYERPYDLEGKRYGGEIFPMEICARDSERKGEKVSVCCIRDLSQSKSLVIDRLNFSIDDAEKNGCSFAVVYIDLDSFKRFNDSLGHQFGDKLLTATARRLRCGLEGQDSLIRHGGDEFIILLQNFGTSGQLFQSVERLHNLFNDEFVVDEHRVSVSATFGISIFPQHGHSASGLLQNAELAMYRCRENGTQGFFAFYSEDMSRIAGYKLEMEQYLRRALENEELLLNYQPVYTYQNGVTELVSAEVLVRWQSEALGFVGPDKFIPIAENTGLIVEIGNWIINTACKQGADWLAKGYPPFQLAINISPRQLRQYDFIDVLQEILRQTEYPAELLCMEITEGILLEDDQYAQYILTQIKGLGISLAIDDFGTGYSSLSYLKRYPFDLLKIDRAFVKDLHIDKSHNQLVKACVLMAHGLNLEVVAEGVETEEQLEFLAEQSCDFYQGYHLNRPMPAQSFEKLLSADEPAVGNL
ncbi:MAG: bifunctional diguanylate cyclase/phosphodiesterase [Neptuniibacter sp.]